MTNIAFNDNRLKGRAAPLATQIGQLSQSLAIEEAALPRLLKLTIGLISGATFAFIVWAACTPVKEIARTQGQVIPLGYNQLVQHLEGGLVRAIEVHEGDYVQAGQLLVRVDGAGAEEDLREQTALISALTLQAERLHAFLENRKPDFSGLDKAQAAEQSRMYDAMLEARRRERTVITAQIEQRRKDVGRLQETMRTAKANLGTATEMHGIYSKLMEQGLTVRSTMLRKEEELNARKGEAGATAMQIQGAQKEINEAQERLSSITATQRDAAYTELHKTESELSQQMEELRKRRERVGRLDVRAPVAGYVKGLKLNTVGAVIPAGQTLMEILPADQKLIVEIRIPTQEIGRVKAGQEVQVKVDSYDYVRYGTIPATLDFISAMTFTDEARHEDYYKGRVTLSRAYAGLVENLHPVIPGMTVDADIVTGEKTVLAYLMKPIRSALNNAMTEQ